MNEPATKGTTMFEQRQTQATTIRYTVREWNDDSPMTASWGSFDTPAEAERVKAQLEETPGRFQFAYSEVVCVTRTVTTVTQIESLPVGAL